jgi:16S rRNA C1402 (ribose-2'-O) methylase RsmI
MLQPCNPSEAGERSQPGGYQPSEEDKQSARAAALYRRRSANVSFESQHERRSSGPQLSKISSQFSRKLRVTVGVDLIESF